MFISKHVAHIISQTSMSRRGVLQIRQVLMIVQIRLKYKRILQLIYILAFF
jgi:hypothetical protein